MALKDGKVFYQKNFGHHTFKKQYMVQDSDVYDLASITKIVATVPTLMHLQEKELLDLNKTLGDYILFSDTSSKKRYADSRGFITSSTITPLIPFLQANL